MSLDSATIDRIVAGILNQISGGGDVRADQVSPPRAVVSESSRNAIRVQDGGKSVGETVLHLNEKVITAQTLEAIAKGSRVLVGGKTIITPAAWDAAKSRNLVIQRQTVANPAKSASSSDSVAAANGERVSDGPQLLIVVRSTEAVERLRDELAGSWKREFVACPDDAAKMAIGELARGGVGAVVILAEQTFRAACLANRHEKVKAVAVQDVLEIKQARKQLRVNTWCINPTSRTWYELRSIMRAIQNRES